MKRDCKGTNKAGKPCKAAALTDNDYCRAHDPLLPAESRFGSTQQAREAATGVERRYPRLREVAERKLEAKADRIVDAQLEALDATRAVVVGDGADAYVEMVPDFLTRLRAGDTLMSRALGKPAQEQTIHADHKVLAVNFDASDPDTRQLIGDILRRRPASRQPVPG
jgi:hypothetical protein